MHDLLSDVYMARVEFHLEFEENFQFRQQMLLHLRRELIGVARASGDQQLLDFIDPGMPDDPYARKLFQKPSPPFVVQAAAVADMTIEAGDSFALKVLFFGNLSQHVALFARLLCLLGKTGFFKGEGRFELDMVVGRDQAVNQQLLWRGCELLSEFSVPQVSLSWYIDDRSLRQDQLLLSFLTPARLLSDGKPLFNPGFVDIFPFLLRRVTSMLYFWAGIEIAGDPQDLLALAAEVNVESCDLAWHDWRHIAGGDDRQELGGLLGTLNLGQINSDKTLQLLLLGEIFNIGKGAPYGSGAYVLDWRNNSANSR